MHVSFVRSGGFAGILLTANLDSKTLPVDELSVLEREVADASFFDLPEKLLPAAPVPDGFEYEITVDSSNQTHTVRVGEPLVAESLRPLIDHLVNLARTGKYR